MRYTRWSRSFQTRKSTNKCEVLPTKLAVHMFILFIKIWLYHHSITSQYCSCLPFYRYTNIFCLLFQQSEAIKS